MNFGISTACLYPMEIDKAFKFLAENNVEYTEVFLNTFSEMENDYLYKIKEMSILHNTKIVSVHPFSSFMEAFLFATDYPTRFADGEKLYRTMFKACNILGAKILVFHGDLNNNSYEFEKYCLNYKKLREIGKEYNVSLCQENVARCKSSNSKNIMLMRKYLNDDVEFVLDIKQAIRANEKIEDMLNAMKGKIKHIHLSDNNDKNDCLLLGEGNMDFYELKTLLNKQNYKGNIILEVYSNAYKEPIQLCNCIEWIKNIMV